MVRLLILMISIGLADSLNPSTLAPALYLASGERPRTRVIAFTLAVFVVYLAGGALIALGPGQIIRNAVSDVTIRRTIRYVAEIVAGVLLLVGAGLVWRRRHRLVVRGLPGARSQRRSSALLGAAITAVELPTAFPYFAAIAAILGSGLGAVREFVLLLVFNLSFVVPLIAIILVLYFGGDRTHRLLRAARQFLERRWPHIVFGLLLAVGVLAILIGATGLASGIHGRVGRFFKHFRRTIHP